MKNLLNNISQEEKERILEMHKKNITIISEQGTGKPLNIKGVEYLNSNITSEAKLNAFLDTGDLTRESFPSLDDRFRKISDLYVSGKKDGDIGMQELLRTYENDKIPKFVRNYLIYIAKQKRNPSDFSIIGKHFEGPFKGPYDVFRTFTTPDGKETFTAVDSDNKTKFTMELFNLIQKQTEKAKRA